LGFLFLLGAGLFVVAGTIAIIGEGGGRLFPCVVGFLSCVFAAFFYYGLGEVLSLVAGIAESTRSASAALQRYLPATAQAAKSSSSSAVPSLDPPIPPKTARNVYYYFAEQTEEGPY